MTTAIYKNRSSADALALARAKKYNGLIDKPSGHSGYIRDILDEKLTRMIIQVVSARRQISYDDMRQDTLRKEIVVPRQICMALIKDRTELTLFKIGELFNRDHATVLHAVNKAIPSWLLDHKFRIEFEEIRSEVLIKEFFITNQFRTAS